MPRISYRKKLWIKKVLRIGLILLAVALVAAVALLLYLAPFVTYDREGAHLNLNASEGAQGTSDATGQRPTVDDAQVVYNEPEADSTTIAGTSGYYVTAQMLQTPEQVLQAVQALEKPCAVMLELKSTHGYFYYDTGIDGAETADVDLSAVGQLISYLSEHGFYLIAEIPAFSDSSFALQNQSCGLPLSNGALWVDEQGCYWLDPANKTVLSYLRQIAQELSSLGFREVVFSSFRFPASNNISYHSEKSGSELVAEAAKELTTFFAASNLMISFATDETAFPTASCAGRLYIEGADGSKVEKYLQVYGSADTLAELVFLANSRDTRFDGQAVLRPLLAQ